MAQIEKMLQMNSLFDMYGKLLNERDQAVFKAYYQEDWSLTEISERLELTKQRISQILKRCETLLLSYEASLKFQEKENKKSELVDQLAKKYPNETLIKDLIKLLEE